VTIALLLLAGLGPCAETSACTAKLRAPVDELPALRAGLARAGLPEGEPKAVAKLEPKVLRGDTAFALEVETKTDGTVVRALSLHRPPSVYGVAKLRPVGYITKEQRLKAAETSYAHAIAEAMEDLTAQLAEAAGVGKRTVKLSVRVNALESLARRHVVETYLPCIKGQFDQLGAVTEPREVAGYLEDVVEYAPAKDEPRDSLQWQANRLRELTHAPKAKCPPPPKYIAKFTPDTVNRGIVIEFK
jgi:hypothetical protein